MIDFINRKEEYEIQKSRFLELFKEGVKFPEFCLNDSFKCFLAFEFDFIYHNRFFNGLQHFLKCTGLKKYVFFTISPSPEEYYFKCFSKYSVIEVPIVSTSLDLNEIMMRNPGVGEHNLDSLALSSNDVAFFSSSNEWCIIGSREWEIAIIGFTSKELKNSFTDSFEKSVDMFTSVEKQVECLDEILNFNEQIMSDYKKLIENYKGIC